MATRTNNKSQKSADELSKLIASFGANTAKSETEKSYVWIDYDAHVIAIFPKKGGKRTVFTQSEERDSIIWTTFFIGKEVITDDDRKEMDELFK